jgi:hypothetical protein
MPNQSKTKSLQHAYIVCHAVGSDGKVTPGSKLEPCDRCRTMCWLDPIFLTPDPVTTILCKDCTRPLPEIVGLLPGRLQLRSSGGGLEHFTYKAHGRRFQFTGGPTPSGLCFVIAGHRPHLEPIIRNPRRT